MEDGSASTSACSLEIKVGNFLDPPHLPGENEDTNESEKVKVIGPISSVKVKVTEGDCASTSAYSLEIKVGNFLDPPHLPGAALIVKVELRKCKWLGKLH